MHLVQLRQYRSLFEDAGHFFITSGFISGFLPTIEAIVLRKPSDKITYGSEGHRSRVVGVQSNSEVHACFICDIYHKCFPNVFIRWWLLEYGIQ